MASSLSLISPLTALDMNDSVAMVATASNFLSRDECRQVIMLGDRVIYTEGTVGNERRSSKVRDSKVTCLRPGAENMWLFKRLESALVQMNNAYRYDLLGFYEGVQVASYTSGGKYDWHIDLGAGENSCRKLSMSVQLSDPGSYKGGNLEFMNINQEPEREIGSLIVFPSFLQHRVTTVTQGTRRSLVAWVHGKPFS